MSFWQRCKVAYNLIVRGWNNMTLVYILALEMGLVTPDQIPATDLENVKVALKNLGKEDLLG